MRAKLIEHIFSILLVSAILIALLLVARNKKDSVDDGIDPQVKAFAGLTFVNFDNPFDKALLGDVLDLYYPGQHDKNRLLIGQVEQFRDKVFMRTLQASHTKDRLTGAKILQLLGMYLKFLIVYVIVLFLTFYGVQTLGTWRFVMKKRHAQSGLSNGTATMGQRLKTIAASSGKVIGSFILFCPAYVIAYSVRTEFGTDTAVFMVLLAVISNGLLIMYANKFYAFLVAESRRGYVETALVKNVQASYSQNPADGIPYKALFKPIKSFSGHVFGHIFTNAQHQYFSSIKEQATFLITGLIIIEMALNIHGHLNYEMLRQILYKNYDIVIAIILSIFYTVKATEIGVDYLMYRHEKKYENRE